MKLCDGDCTIKKEIGNNVSFSSTFLQANVKMVDFIFKKRDNLFSLCARGIYKKSAS